MDFSKCLLFREIPKFGTHALAAKKMILTANFVQIDAFNVAIF